jgi:hypothetical protein
MAKKLFELLDSALRVYNPRAFLFLKRRIMPKGLTSGVFRANSNSFFSLFFIVSSSI